MADDAGRVVVDSGQIWSLKESIEAGKLERCIAVIHGCEVVLEIGRRYAVVQVSLGGWQQVFGG
jgi:hypothetical protein